MLKSFACIVLLSAIPVLAQNGPKAEKVRQAELILDPNGPVVANGVWRPDDPTKRNGRSEAVVELSCFRNGGKDLVGTEAFCLQETATAAKGALQMSTRWLKVVEWSGTQITASDESAVCLTSQTVFDLKRKTVSASDVRRPGANGSSHPCDLTPERQTYYLQDVVDYFVQKVFGTTKVNAGK